MAHISKFLQQAYDIEDALYKHIVSASKDDISKLSAAWANIDLIRRELRGKPRPGRVSYQPTPIPEIKRSRTRSRFRSTPPSIPPLPPDPTSTPHTTENQEIPSHSNTNNSQNQT